MKTHTKMKLADFMKSVDKDIESDDRSARWLGMQCIREIIQTWIKGDLMILYNNLGDYARSWLFAYAEQYRPDLYQQIAYLDNRP